MVKTPVGTSQSQGKCVSCSWPDGNSPRTTCPENGKMKHIVAFATLFMTSCAPFLTHHDAQSLPTTQENRLLENFARHATVQVSAGDWEGRPYLATDGDIDTWWSANDFAPQWLEITLPYVLPVQKIELIVTQAAPGPATHKVVLESADAVVAWHRFDTDLALDGHVFSLRLDPPRYVEKVRVLTTRHEGWVA